MTVRDRDHIRQTVLEGLGWNIYRIWSTDWFADPERQTAIMLEWLDRRREEVLRQMAATAKSDADWSEQPARRSNPDCEPAGMGPSQEAVALTVTTESKSVHTADAPLQPAANTQEGNEKVADRPRGELMRELGSFQWYNTLRNQLYEVWFDDELAGDVEVLRRANAAPKLYGDRAVIPRPEYEGRVEMTGETFRSDDLYKAVREVARRAGIALGRDK